MTEGPSRGSRIGLYVGLAIGTGVVVWSLTAPGLEVEGGLAAFDETAVDETVYVAAAFADAPTRLLRVWTDTVGPVDVTPVLCPDDAVGSARTCRGGPIDAYDVDLPGMGNGTDGENIVVLAVRRTGPEPAGICSVRVVYATGGRLGTDASDTQILLQPDDELAPICG